MLDLITDLKTQHTLTITSTIDFGRTGLHSRRQIGKQVPFTAYTSRWLRIPPLSRHQMTSGCHRLNISSGAISAAASGFIVYHCYKIFYGKFRLRGDADDCRTIALYISLGTLIISSSASFLSKRRPKLSISLPDRL